MALIPIGPWQRDSTYRVPLLATLRVLLPHVTNPNLYIDHKSCKQYIYVTVFRKTNRSARKSIMHVNTRSIEHEDANGKTEKEERFTRRLSVGLASNLDSGIFARRKR